MTRTRTAALLAAAALSAFLAACGGGSDGDGDTASTAIDGLTPPGSTLELGEEALVGWVSSGEAGASSAPKGKELAVAVESVERGSISDFVEYDLNADERENVPYYVTYWIRALEQANAEADSYDPSREFEAFDESGEAQRGLEFIERFEPCVERSVPHPLKAGQTARFCVAYLLPKGTSIVGARWENGPDGENEVSPYSEDPIVWEGN